MPIPVVCAECKSRLNAPDAAAGKTLRCPKCQMALVVPAAAAMPEFEVVDEEPTPAKKPTAAPPAKKKIIVEDDDDEDDRPKARKRRDDDEDDRPRARKRSGDDDVDEDEDDEDRPRKKKKGKKAAAGMSPAAIAAIVGGVLVVGGGAFAAYWFGIREKPAETVKNNNETQPPNGAPPKSVPGGKRPRRTDENLRDPIKMTSNNNLKQLALGFHNAASTYGFAMPSGVYDSSGKVGLSWRVALLPFIEEGELYKQFHLNEPWDSPHNKQLISRMPRTYAKPGVDPSGGMTHYRTITGAGTIFPPPPPGKPGRWPLV